MARRRRQSGAEDFMDLVAKLPWWGGVALALVGYLVLHQLAIAPRPTTFRPEDMQGAMLRTVMWALAFIGQYVWPALCLLGALVSFLRRRKRISLVDNVTRSSSAEALNAMSWREFELLVGEAFRLQGFQVTEHGGAGADGGVDLTLRKGTETFLVQCKQWKALQVGVELVRQLYGVMAATGAAGGFVITSGRFTPDAQAFAEGRNLQLMEGAELFALIQQAKAAGKPAASAAVAKPSAKAAPQAANGATPLCPVCQGSMMRRTARKGAHAGTQFWGCSKYPACRGTR